MLYLNSKFIDFNNPAPEFREIADDFHKKTAKLKERFGQAVTIISRKEPKLNATGIIEPVANATIPLHIATKGANGREEWLYCEVAPEFKDGVLVPETKQKIVQYGELRIDLETDPDFAYFLLEKHSMIKRGKYVLVDNESDEKKKADKRAREVSLTSMIYGENSQLNLDLNFLRLVAKRWGVGAADGMSKPVLQNALYDQVTASENKKGGRGIDDFLKDVKSTDNAGQLKIAGTVRDAIDSKAIVFDNVTKQWLINYQDGVSKPLMTVAIEDMPKKEEILILYLQSDNHLYSQLLAAMGGEKSVVKASIEKEAVRNTDDLSALRGYAKSLGINSFGKKKDELRVEILDKLQEATED